MKFLRKKHRRTEISENTYRLRTAELTLLNLETIDISYAGKVTKGCHKVIVELKSRESQVNAEMNLFIKGKKLKKGKKWRK